MMDVNLRLRLYEIVRKLSKEFPGIKTQHVIEEISPGIFNYEENKYAGTVNRDTGIITLCITKEQVGNRYDDQEIVRVFFKVYPPVKLILSASGKPIVTNVYRIKELL